MRPCLLAVLVFVCLGLPRAATAQSVSSESTGTWIGGGVGGGSARVSCAICRRERDLGPAAHLRIGTVLGPGLLLGGEVHAWTHENEDEIRSIVGSALASIQLYPRLPSGLFLRAGLGWVRYSAREDGEDQEVSANLPGLLVGAGWDLPVGAGLSLTNYVGVLASSYGSLRRERTSVVDDVSVSVLQLGIGLTRR